MRRVPGFGVLGMVVSRPTAIQAPLVNYNGVPCYYINGNYYPATAMQ